MTTPEHRAGEKREISEEAGEVFVAGHVADAEDENAKADERDHHQHRGGERIENPADAQRLFAESEPGEIVNGAEAGRLQRRQERQDREYERDDLADDRQCGCAFVAPIRQAQNRERSRERHRRDQPKMIDDPVGSSFELVELIDVGRAIVPIDRDDQRKTDGGFGGGDRDREDRDHHAGRWLRLRAEAPEGDEIEIRRGEHHLDADQNENGVTPAQRREQADAKTARRRR